MLTTRRENEGDIGNEPARSINARRLRRTETEIIAEILNASRDGMSFSKLIVRANLNTATLYRYLELLTDRGFLQIKDSDMDCKEGETLLNEGKSTKEDHESRNESMNKLYTRKRHVKSYIVTNKGLEFLSAFEQLELMTQKMGSALKKNRTAKEDLTNAFASQKDAQYSSRDTTSPSSPALTFEN
jgi:predicted transcriptional regulator